jgi:hypothetical protein
MPWQAVNYRFEIVQILFWGRRASLKELHLCNPGK